MKLGENAIGTRNRVIQQNSYGSLFMSQDGSLWTEDQTQDVKFTLRRCQFKSNQVSEIELKNSPLKAIRADNDPIETSGRAGTSGVFGSDPSIVKLKLFNHGLSVGDFFYLEGVDGNPGGIPNDRFNTLHQVLTTDLLSLTFKVDTTDVASVRSIRSGGDSIFCSYNRAYETVNLYAGIMNFPTTDIICRNRTTQHAGVTLFNQDKEYTQGQLEQIPIMEDYYYNGPKQVAHYLNEIKNNESTKLNGRTSLETRFRMTTSSDKVSPVVDLSRTNLNIVRNLIDKPIGGGSNFINPNSSRKFVMDLDGDITGVERGDIVTIGQNQYSIDNFDLDLNRVELYGAYIHPDDRQIEIPNVGTFSINLISRQIQIDYLEETQPMGTTFAKWISKVFTFENECDGIELKVSAIVYDHTSIRAYYQPKSVGNVSETNDSSSWIPFNVLGPFNMIDENGNDVLDDNGNPIPVPGLPNNATEIRPRDPEKVNPDDFNAGEYQELVWSVQDLAKFNGLSIKLVMVATNPALGPIIDDFRLVASE